MQLFEGRCNPKEKPLRGEREERGRKRWEAKTSSCVSHVAAASQRGRAAPRHTGPLWPSAQRLPPSNQSIWRERGSNVSPAPSPGPEFPHCRAVLPSRWVSWACQTSSGEGARHVTPARECWEEAELPGLPFSHPGWHSSPSRSSTHPGGGQTGEPMLLLHQVARATVCRCRWRQKLGPFPQTSSQKPKTHQGQEKRDPDKCQCHMGRSIQWGVDTINLPEKRK